MKIFLNILFFIVINGNIVYCQIPLKSKEYIKTDVGFIYITKRYNYSITFAFAPLKVKQNQINFKDFNTDKLGIAFQLNREVIDYDTLEKYGDIYQLYNYLQDSFFVNIIPIEVTYTVYEYAMTKNQLKKNTFKDRFQFIDKFVAITVITGMSLQINSIKAISKMIEEN